MEYSDNPDSSKMVVNDVVVKYRASRENTYSTVEQAQEGVPVSAFFDLLEVTGLSKIELSGLLDVSFKTIQRYQKENKKLSALNSEQILKMITLYQKAEEVFGDVASFNRWLRKPALGLAGQHPLKFMQTPGGIDLIYDELMRIEHGLLA
ncbi:MAG: antitoxin Xre/MbcA/ParS toxin-binding domain-containing protein [Cyclonatronaceae bacterium]